MIRKLHRIKKQTKKSKYLNISKFDGGPLSVWYNQDEETVGSRWLVHEKVEGRIVVDLFILHTF